MTADLSLSASTSVDDGRAKRRPPALWSACALVFTAIVAGVVYMNLKSGLLFCTSERYRGANVEHGLGIAFYGSIAAAVAIPFVRRRRRALAVVLLVGAAALGAAMVYVALDRASYVGTNSCGFMETTDTHINDRLYYLFVLWGFPFALLCWFAVRAFVPRRLEPPLRRRRILVRAGVATTALVAIASAVALSHSRPPAQAMAASHDQGVFVCKNPIRTAEALGGPWVCPSDADIGNAPITPPGSLLCSTDLRGVKNKAIGVQVVYGTTMIEHGTLHSSDATTSPYAEFDGSYVDGVGNGNRLPAGRYRCRFLVDDKLAASRTITVGRATLARTPGRFHYALDVERPKSGAHVTSTHRGDEFTIRFSSPDLPRKRMAMVELCVNHVHGTGCSSFFVTGGAATNVVWDVSRGEGKGSLYRLTIEAQGRELARRDLQLVPRT
jgi:hypothetical protein